MPTCIAIIFLALISCSSIKPYEKEYLLHPLMDDASLQTLSSPFTRASFSKRENLASGIPGAGNATSCPTCGG